MPNRREVLQWAAALAVLPSACVKPGSSTTTGTPPTPGYFTDEERDTLGALADAVLPPDEDPGASALGAVDFIERLLTAFDAPVPEIHAGGPFSNRQPFPDDNGAPSTRFPDNAFATWVPLTRVAEKTWRLYLYGSDGVEGGGPNDGVLGKIIGVREQMKTGLARARERAGTPLSSLDVNARANAFDALDQPFRDLLLELVPQAAFAAPEYGGNRDGAGWRMLHYEGDSLPLGYSQWDSSTESFRERADAPNTTPNPQPDPAPLDDDVKDFLRGIITTLGGREFP